jgi:hypothetical protein
VKDKRVFIEVTDTRAISSDAKQWMLMRRNKKVDKNTQQPVGGYTEWTAYSYPSSFEFAAAGLEKELQRTCGAQTFTELRRMADHIHKLMLKTLDAAKLPSVTDV